MKKENIYVLPDWWYGVNCRGGRVSISHSNLMEWATRNNMQFQVGWGTTVVIDTLRLVRGGDPTEARKAGWDDVADSLESFIGKWTQIGEGP